MDVKELSDIFAVSPQIHVSDLEQLKADGYTRVICNRPSGESMLEDQPDSIRKAAENLGLEFIENPIVPGQMTLENVEAQRIESGKTLAYCASGTRSSIAWALSVAGRMGTAEILERMEKAGFPMPALGPQLDAMASR